MKDRENEREKKRGRKEGEEKRENRRVSKNRVPCTVGQMRLWRGYSRRGSDGEGAIARERLGRGRGKHRHDVRVWERRGMGGRHS